MKYILIITIFLSNFTYANYNYGNENYGKIDMHGGKGNSLLNTKNSFSNKSMSSLSNIGIKKPSTPLAPKPLIKKDKNKETTK